LELWASNICPNCGQQIPPVKGAGSGQSKKGGFCSLDGYASFYEYEIIETARRIFEAMKKYGES
jgi:hypothetical protein